LAAIPILVRGDRAPSPPREARLRGGALAFARTTPHFFGAAVLFGLLETGGGSMLVSWGLALQVSETEALTLAAAFAAGGLLFQPLFAYAAERMAPERLMTVAALVCLAGATAALSASALSFPLLMALLFFWGGPTAGLYIAALVAVGRRLEGPALAAANAALVSGYGLGALTGPLAMGVGLQQLGPNGLPLSVMVAALLYLPILARAAARP
ncbi:MAG: MFS transporter, partial [Pseudomonadota bacterium]